MKTVLFLFALIWAIPIYSQSQYNYFEVSDDLDIQIDTATGDTLWQIGLPQKVFFNEAYSFPLAILTDTINNYPINHSASFIVELNESTTWSFPEIQIEWWQKTDFEEGIDGGIIEASYDQGQTWSNVFTDTIYRPLVVGNYQIDTLHTGEVGITGTSDWSWMALCWGEYFGIAPGPWTISTVEIRYTSVSDSIETNQEGWMIDNMVAFTGVIGISTSQVDQKGISLYPNPVRDELYIDFSDIELNKASVQIYDSTGHLVLSGIFDLSDLINQTISVAGIQEGLYYLQLRTDSRIYNHKFYKSE